MENPFSKLEGTETIWGLDDLEGLIFGMQVGLLKPSVLYPPWKSHPFVKLDLIDF